MRRIIKRIAITAVLGSAFMGIASAAPASAANCPDYGTGPTYYVNGKLHFDFHLLKCTGVDQIQVEVNPGGVGSFALGGWVDHSIGSMITPDQPWSRLWGRLGVNLSPGIIDNYAKTPWCNGAAHVVNSQFNFRLHNISTHTWGPWHIVWRSNEAILC